MDAHTRKVYVPMTETGFYILLCLREPNHGYGIVQKVKELTDGEIVLAPGTMYGSLSKMERDGIIQFVKEEEKRKLYVITDLGWEVLKLEFHRIDRLYRNMKETKTCFRFFSIMDYEKEADFLRKMHKKGWKFVKVSLGGFYGFEACEPEDVVYQLDYNPDGVKHQNEYLQMFKDCGWEYLQDFAGYSYFRKPVSEMDGDESIFCDDESRLDMATRVIRGKGIPLLVILLHCTTVSDEYHSLQG